MSEAMKGEISKYITAHRIDGLIGSLIELLIRDRPTTPIPYLIDHIFQKAQDEVRPAFEDIRAIYSKEKLLDESADSKSFCAYKKQVFEKVTSKSDAKDDADELEAYLKTKKINSMFNSIVENMLLVMAESPYSFIITYFFQKHRMECKHIIDDIMFSWPYNYMKTKKPKKESKNNDYEADDLSIASRMSDSKGDYNSLASKASLNEESDEEDEDDIVDMPEPAPMKTGPRFRRTSVSAESTDYKQIEEQMKQVANHPKSQEVMAVLRKIVGKSPLLRALEPEQKEAIVKAFAGPFDYDDNHDIIVQGDIGDTFYLLEEGSVEVYIKKRGEDIKVGTYKPGDGFGQLAIMYNTPRAATCRVVGGAKLWALDRLSFKCIVVAAAMQKRDKYQQFLAKVPVLQSLTEMEIMTLADALAEEVYSDGDVICTEGEEGDYFYIVLKGRAEVSKDGEVLNPPLEEGNFFGERALIKNEPRAATVIARGLTKVLAIDRATFTRVMGSMDSILGRNL